MRIDLDALFATSPSPHVLLDGDLRMVWANDAYLAVTGRSRDGLIGRVITEEFPVAPDSVADQLLRTSLRRVFDHGVIDHLPLIPYPISGPDGLREERYWSATHTPLKNADGVVEYILQNTNDVTRLYVQDAGRDLAPLEQVGLLQRAEAITRANLELGTVADFFRSVFDQAPSFIAILTGPDHVFQIVNEAYVSLVGRADLVGKPVREAVPDVAGQGFFELLDKVYTTGEPVTLRGAPLSVLRDGNEVPHQLFVDFVFQPLRGSMGRTAGIFVQGHDVTRQKEAEAELLETQERFRSMAQSMPNHVWTATSAGELDWINRQVYLYSGEPEGTLEGTGWARIIHPDDLPATLASWTEAIRHSLDYETEFRIRRADGAYRWHIVRATPIRGADGTALQWVGTNTDIQDRKTAEAAIATMNVTLEERVAQRNRELEVVNAALRQSQKMEAVGNLAGGIAHDFNNLLQAISGSLQLTMRRLEKDDEARTRLGQAMRAVERGATLASQLLSFGRRQPLQPKVINLGRLLREADNIVRSAIGEGVEVETIVAGGLWNTCVDPANVQNAVLNLAINARDAMDGQGKLTIEIGNACIDDSYARLHSDVAPGQYVMLAVSDTGCGMTPEVMEQVFDPFFTTKPDGKGTGLGMSMVYGFVKQSGGHVKIYSEVGSGTAIKIYLPRSTEQEDVLRPAIASDMTGGTETILLVEDDEDVRATGVSLLTDLGYTVLQARDADRAMIILESGARVDLLFTDVVMPGRLTSRQLSERAKAMKPDLAVLFTSGYTQNSIVHGGRLDPGIQLLSKPYTQEELARKIRQVLGPAAETPVPPDIGTLLPDSAEAEDLFAGLEVVVCEDEVIIRMNLVDELSDLGCTVREAGTGRRALELLATAPARLLIADVGLPDMSGVDLALRACAAQPDLAIIFATGEHSVAGIDGLPKAAVLTKPFAANELADAIRVLLAGPT